MKSEIKRIQILAIAILFFMGINFLQVQLKPDKFQPDWESIQEGINDLKWTIGGKNMARRLMYFE